MLNTMNYTLLEKRDQFWSSYQLPSLKLLSLVFSQLRLRLARDRWKHTKPKYENPEHDDWIYITCLINPVSRAVFLNQSGENI